MSVMWGGEQLKLITDLDEEIVLETMRSMSKERNNMSDNKLVFIGIEGQSADMSKINDSNANSRQPGGNHYLKHNDLQPWDVVVYFNLDFFQGNIIKYVIRFRDKNGIQDLEKARHYLDKLIEIEKAKASQPNPQTSGNSEGV